MKTKIQYTTPTVKVVSFKVENMFLSNPTGSKMLSNSVDDLLNPDRDLFNAQGQENWNTDGQGNNSVGLFESW